jgi:hypothetical protein
MINMIDLIQEKTPDSVKVTIKKGDAVIWEGTKLELQDLFKILGDLGLTVRLQEIESLV